MRNKVVSEYGNLLVGKRSLEKKRVFGEDNILVAVSFRERRRSQTVQAEEKTNEQGYYFSDRCI